MKTSGEANSRGKSAEKPPIPEKRKISAACNRTDWRGKLQEKVRRFLWVGKQGIAPYGSGSYGS